MDYRNILIPLYYLLGSSSNLLHTDKYQEIIKQYRTCSYHSHDVVLAKQSIFCHDCCCGHELQREDGSFCDELQQLKEEQVNNLTRTYNSYFPDDWILYERDLFLSPNVSVLDEISGASFVRVKVFSPSEGEKIYDSKDL